MNLRNERRNLIYHLLELTSTEEQAKYLFGLATVMDVDNMALFDAIQGRVDKINGVPNSRQHLYED